MRFAVICFALCLAVDALPVDTSTASGLTNIAETSDLLNTSDDTSQLAVRQQHPVDNVPVQSGPVYDITVEISHIRHSIEKTLKDSLKSIDPELGHAVSMTINRLNNAEKALLDQVIPGRNLYARISPVIHHTGETVVDIEEVIKQEGTTLNPSVGLLLHQLFYEVSDIEADIVSVGFNTR